jgi:alcohol dehydrogenase class IV
MKEPKARIIRYKVNHHISSGWKNYRILSNCLTIDAEVWLIVPDWLCAESGVTTLTHNTRRTGIFASDIGVKI